MIITIKMIRTGGSDYRRGEGYPADSERYPADCAATVKITNIHKEEINSYNKTNLMH